MTRRVRRPPYRDGRIFICSVQCSDCVFRPGNLMRLQPGRLKDIVDANLANEAALPCHQTTYGARPDGEAICRGYVDGPGADQLWLRLARAMRIITEVSPAGSSKETR